MSIAALADALKGFYKSQLTREFDQDHFASAADALAEAADEVINKAKTGVDLFDEAAEVDEDEEGSILISSYESVEGAEVFFWSLPICRTPTFATCPALNSKKAMVREG